MGSPPRIRFQEKARAKEKARRFHASLQKLSSNTSLDPLSTYFHLREEVRRSVLPKNQIPQQSAAMEKHWCFVECQINDTKAELTSEQEDLIKAIVNVTANSRSPSVEGNSVYIGRRSAVSCTLGSVADAYPFGCELLQRVAQSRGDAEVVKLAAPLSITARTKVNVRKRLPSTFGTFVMHECKVKVLSAGQAVRVQTIAAYDLSQDTQFYAIIEGKQEQQCMS
jgi:hypothetical protein